MDSFGVLGGVGGGERRHVPSTRVSTFPQPTDQELQDGSRLIALITGVGTLIGTALMIISSLKV